MKTRITVPLLVAFLLIMLAACQPLDPAMTVEDGEEGMTDSTAPTVTFTAADYAFDGPDSIPGGLTRIEFVNPGEQEHSLWLIKLEDG